MAPSAPAAGPPQGPAFDAAAHARETARLIGLEIAPAHLPGVVANLQLAAQMAALVQGWPLDITDEPAPVFVAR
ncbi:MULTISPECIES: DUF4089 domain-containing protein [Roseomonadaceae]|uniref:DUF4089 domain-containing protein n=1 Tax=Falsiroseomonas oleicola TaxID=2801474 RepID=A0ABS6H560_9PROT|nr:DUF4089 domain-containing protein [Roseomonas oleicola]MBU8543789.1 DUF4089 domain-containing protein [Roseomonas oleicola]